MNGIQGSYDTRSVTSGGGGGTVYMGVAGSSGNTDKTSTRVRDAVTATEQSTAELHAVISALEQRLDTILAPLPAPMPITSTPPMPPSPTQLADRVSDVNHGCCHAISRLQSLLSRIEL